HGPAVAEWITAHERTLAQLGDAGLSIDLTDDSLTAERDAHIAPLGAAIAEHPSAVMRAELSAMQVAADATVHGVRRSEYATAERQHVTYVEYRDLWVGRLRQFSLDDPEIAELRRGLSQDTGVGRPPENGDLRLSS
ncbi:MAG: hypothetical protein OEU32_18750, partial [Acidimicrobiia bacterium]|nr:hypothetical protein [Acidimicrobiia bacterium]